MTSASSSSNRSMPHPDVADVPMTAVLFALSESARLDLVRLLDSQGEQTVAQCHAVDPQTPKSTFSHHLRTLREAGVIRNEPQGRQRRITLRRDELDARFPGLLDAVLGPRP